MESFLIAENYVPKPELKLVAETILKAQDIHEESWNGADSKYTKTMGKAAVEALEPTKLPECWDYIITNWLVVQWNESQDWAKDILGLNVYNKSNKEKRT